MALLFIEGFDYDNTAAKFNSKPGWSGASLPTLLTGRYGSGYALYMISTSDYATKNIGVNKSILYFGMAVIKASAGVPTFHTSYVFINFRDEASVSQVKIFLNASYGLSVYNGDNTLLGATADYVFNDLVWQYLEIKVKVHETLGEVEIRINEQTVLNLTNVDTKNGSDFIRQITLRPLYSNITTYYDDMYGDDAQFHGNCRVRTFTPDADGTHTDFDRSGGANDYEAVDEIPPNDDTDYIYTVTKGHKSTFGITTGLLGVVKGMQVANRVRTPHTGLRRHKELVRSGGVDYRGPVHGIVASTYEWKASLWQTDPQDDAAWNQTKLEAAEYGLEVVDGTTTTSTSTTTTAP